MAYRILWHEQAKQSLERIVDYLIDEADVAWVADKLIQDIEYIIENYIAEMPAMFALTSQKDIHACCLVYPYIMYYRRDDKNATVRILDIIHGAQGGRRL